MRSGLAWAILGLVIEQASYGYELVQRFERTYGETLVLRNRTHIYRLLEMLRVRSLIEETSPPAEMKVTRQSKPHYRATDLGMRAYQEWLVTQAEGERRRARMFVRQLAMLQPEDALSVIDRYAQECLEEVGEGSAADEAERSRDVAERLADEDVHLAFGARVSWIEYARRELKALAARKAQEPGQG
jgi:DNA-binding PadR family transcriptional regulator